MSLVELSHVVKRFGTNTVLDDVSAPITLRQNWSPEGKK